MGHRRRQRVGRDDAVRILMPHPYDRLRRIATPREGMAGCASQVAYAARHARQMAAMRTAYPALGIRDPWEATECPVPFVLGGKWVVVCPCGDAPMASPEWDEARCFQCGAMYHGLAWPPDRVTLEALLVARPAAAVRAWLPHETLDELRGENAAHGIEVIS